MEYAIGLYFDKDSESKFNNLIQNMVQGGVNNCMLEHKITPHTTLANVSAEDATEIIKSLDKNIACIYSGEIFWASIGVFMPLVIYAAPVLNEYLSGLNVQINNLLKTVTETGRNGFYLPYQWVPHTALAVKMNQDELKIAFNIVTNEFVAFGGVAERLFLAQCNPFKELKTWELSRIV